MPILIIIPLAVGCVIGLSATSPFDETERLTVCSMAFLRLWHLGGLLALGALSLTLMALWWPDPLAGRTAVCNLAGFTGLTTLTAVALGGRLSWIPALVWGTTALFGERPDDHAPWYVALRVWPILSGQQQTATVFVALLLGTGVSTLVVLGERRL